MRIRTNATISVMAAVIFGLSLVAAYYVNTDLGTVSVETVSITSNHGQMSGLLYKPDSLTNANPAPAVVLAHGISSSKQFLSGIALEIARNGILALTIDLYGHGGSEGQLANGADDPTLGTLACVRYLEAQPYVNSSRIGLVGHSLGAGAIRATAATHGNIRAAVFIGGGFGSMVAGSAYGILNATFPRNLLVAVGKQDVLFDLPNLQQEILPQVFGTATKVEADVLYGDFATQTARELITPSTTHLFEPLDPVITSKTAQWLITALAPDNTTPSPLSAKALIFPYRDIAVTVSLIALITLVISISILVLNLSDSSKRERQKNEEDETPFLNDWKILLIWGASSLLLYFPMVLIGFALNVPPVFFGASFAWWLLATGLVGLSAVALMSRFSRTSFNMRRIILQAFRMRETVVIVAGFILLYLLAFLFETFLKINLGLVTPVYVALTQTRRIAAFVMFLPFFLVYFVVEGLLLHEYRRTRSVETGWHDTFLDFVKVESLKIGPFLAILFLQYVPLFAFGYMLFSGFAGFLIEFLVLQPILFAVSTACSWWLYRNAGHLGAGAVFNTLMFAWVAAAIFPF